MYLDSYFIILKSVGIKFNSRYDIHIHVKFMKYYTHLNSLIFNKYN